MLISTSTSPSPADSPAATSSPTAPPLSLRLPPLPAVLPPFSSRPPPLAPSPAAAAPVVSLPPTLQPPSPVESPPPPSTSESPPLPTSPAKSPPPSPLPAVSTPAPSVSPPVTTTSPPPPIRLRVPRPSLPSPANPSPPFSPEPTPRIPLLPKTSPPPTQPLSATPSSSSSAPPPKKSPAAKLPFFGPLGPIPDKPKGPLTPPLGPIIVPKSSPGESGSKPAPSPALLPLVPKSLPDTESYHRPSAGLLFGGVIVGVLLLVLLGLLFVCYRATRNGRDKSEETDPSDKPPKHQRQELSAVPAGAQVITEPPPTYAPPLRIKSVGYSTRDNGSGSGSVLGVQAPTAVPTLNVTVSSGTFTYEELSEATSGFSDANLLGQGGFGYVHKGVLKNGREVAVKQLKIGSHQGEREFQAEVDMISRIHHKHLVSFVGYCINRDGRLLVYEFVPNSTLEFHLHGSGTHVLEWETRLRIAVGAAKGLAYLHEDCSPTIIHRDIKAANILLDSNFEAKVSDFGLAKFFSDANSSITHISTRVVGTFGYMAPEYASSGKLTDKSDVYSFGVVLLELITGRPPIIAKDPFANRSLIDWARPLLAKALEDGDSNPLIDPNLQGNYNSTRMASMVACAAACIRHSAWLRPRMSQIVRALEAETPFTKFDERITPGHSTASNSSRTSNNNLQLYKTGMRRFHSGLTDEHTANGYSGSTSEYGVNPSHSSSEYEVTV